MITGRLNSIESMSTQDGPGLRTVIFLQGCSLRCRYCHNPDAWSVTGGEPIASGNLTNQIRQLTPYLDKNGGVTLSGGEPLMQPEFVLELLYNLKKTGLHTTLDTSGWQSKYSRDGNGARISSDRLLEAILQQTDLLMVDIKAPADIEYIELTGKSSLGRDVLLDRSIQQHKKVWLRHVVIPEYNDSEQNQTELAAWITDWVRLGLNLERLTLIPYHRIGLQKYETLGLRYQWQDKPALTPEQLEQFASGLAARLAENFPDARVPFRLEF